MRKYQIVGILNTTPDSYFDGGKFTQVDTAVRRAGELLQEGADIIDIGGESTGPGSQIVSVEQELVRTIPVIEAIKSQYPEAKISIDTYKSAVAREAIGAGAQMINDVTAGRGDSEMFHAVAELGIDIVLMYSKDSAPHATVEPKEYDDVIDTVRHFLEQRIEGALSAGIQRSHIIIDPGMGHFVSSLSRYSFEIIRRLNALSEIAPVYISPSRKSFLEGNEHLPPAERLPATIAASVMAAFNGASYIRTHDVLQVRRAIEVVEALKDGIDENRQ